MSGVRERLRAGDEDGFTLVETMVALGIAASVLLALLASTLFAVRATVTARQNQEAGNYLNQAIELTRSLDYGAITMRTGDLAGDPNIITTGAVPRYDVGTGAEVLDVRDVGAVFPHVETKDTDNGRFIVRRYITVPDGATVDTTGTPVVRRLTVEVSWTNGGTTRTRRAGTLITKTRTGLPLPYFTWAYNGPAPVVDDKPTWVKNPGSAVDYGLVLNNQGARDSWQLAATTAGWSYYEDLDQDGIWSGDTITEPLLTGALTGPIEAGAAPFYVVAHRDIGDTESGTSTTDFTATSVAQPSASPKAVSTRLSVQNGELVPPSPTGSPSPAPSPTSSGRGLYIRHRRGDRQRRPPGRQRAEGL